MNIEVGAIGGMIKGEPAKFDDDGVKAVFDACPNPVRQRLLQLRTLIFEVAEKTAGVGPLDEVLRWGQPSYITTQTGSGSPIRMDRIKNQDGKFALYFICTSGLVDTFKEFYGSDMHFVGSRSIVFDVNDRLPLDELRHCISLALTHHLRKRGHR